MINKIDENKLNSKKFLILSTIILNVVNLIVFVVLKTPIFETNDDPGMSMLVENAAGNSHGVILFSNIVYSKLLQVLYSVIPSIKWYTIVQIGGIFLSSLSITYIIYKKFKFVIGTIINIILSFYTGFLFYYAFQFTKTAAICAVAGILVVFDSFHSETKINKWMKITFGSLLILLASWIRFNSLGMTAIVMSSIGVCIIIDILKQKTEAKEKAKTILNYILVFGLAFGISLPTYIINYNFYKDNEYYQYNGYRAELQDYGFPEYDENVELYESLGISKTDYYYFSNWNMDLDVLTPENVKRLVQAKDKNHSSNFTEDFAKYVLSDELYIIIFAVMLAFIIFDRKKWYRYALPFLFMTFVQAYLAFSGRAGLNRISESLFLATIIAFLCSSSVPKKLTQAAKNRLSAICLSVIIVYLSFFTYLFAVPNKNEIDGQIQFNNLAVSDKDTLYISVINSNYYFETHPKAGDSSMVEFFKPMKPNQTDNLFTLGGWNCYSETNLSVLERYDIKNPYKDCVDNENVVFLSQDPFNRKLLIKYINTNYCADAQIDLVKTINGYKQWRVITHEYDLSNAVIHHADDSVTSNIKVEKSNDAIKITGEAYKNNFDSYKQRCFTVITSSTGESHTYEINLTDNGNDRYYGGYSTLNDKYKVDNAEEATVSVIMQADDMYYRVY